MTQTKTQTQKSKKKKISHDRLVPCRSVVNGGLTYISKRNGYIVRWENFGDTDYISVGELISMLSSNSKFLKTPWIIIDDDEVVEYLGLNKFYEKIFKPEELDDLFELDVDEFKQKIKDTPKGIRDLIIGVAKDKLKNGEFYDLRKVNIINEELETDLNMLIEE